MRYFCHVLDEWIAVSAEIYGKWQGARCVLEETEMKDNNGWAIEKQRKKYGPHVEITLNGKLEVTLMGSNPGGMKIEQFAKQLDMIPATRANADKLGFQLQRLFEEIEVMSGRPSATFEVPIELTDLDEDEGDEPTVIKRVEPSSPFTRMAP